MTELTDLNDTDALNTAISGQSIVGNTANMGGMDNLQQAIAGMLSRFRNANIFRLRDNTDKTKLLAFDLSGLTTATTRTITIPDRSGELSTVPRGHIYGLALSNNGTDATNDIDIAVGQTASADTSPVLMVLASALTKRLDASWAVGTNQGMLDGTESVAGTPDTSTWYHIWLIRRSDTGVVDVLASESATAPTMPTNYDAKRRIGAIYRTSGAAIRAFSQIGDEFTWATPVLDYSGTNPGTSQVSHTLSVPSGLNMTAIVNVLAANTASAVNFTGRLYSTGTVDTAPGNAASPIVQWANVGTFANGVGRAAAQLRVVTNGSAQIASRSLSSDASCSLLIETQGWIDGLGRLK